MHAFARVHGTQRTRDDQMHGAYVLSVPRGQDCERVVDARRTGGAVNAPLRHQFGLTFVVEVATSPAVLARGNPFSLLWNETLQKAFDCSSCTSTQSLPRFARTERNPASITLQGSGCENVNDLTTALGRVHRSSGPHHHADCESYFASSYWHVPNSEEHA
jgi:hypothetical protein